MKNLKALMFTFSSFLTFSQASLAAEEKPVHLPDICKSAVNYVAAFLKTSFYDDGDPGSQDPKSIVLKVEKDQFTLKTKSAGVCSDGLEQTHPKWCQVAGGTPAAYEVKVSEVTAKKTEFPLATVVVVYNRGGCSVESVTAEN